MVMNIPAVRGIGGGDESEREINLKTQRQNVAVYMCARANFMFVLRQVKIHGHMAECVCVSEQTCVCVLECVVYV